MSARAKRYQVIQMPAEMIEEVISQAARLDRSRSWMLQFAWKIARKRLKQNPDSL